MSRALPHLSYFYAEEANPSRDGYHIHALWADAKTLYRKEAWATWFKRFGRARIEPIRSNADVASYCAKYVTKERAWWNVKLQWHRSQALRGEPFSLERDASSSRDTLLPVPQPEFGFTPATFNLASDPLPQAGAEPAGLCDDSRQSSLWEIAADGIWHLRGNNA